MQRLCVLAWLSFVLPLAADEGTWPLNQFPVDAVKQKYNFEVARDFLDRLQLASVRIAGGSGAFVSANGLLLTNQHLIAGCLTKLSSPQHDYLKDGFNAAVQTAELPCTGLDAAVLIGIEDVTKEVKGSAKDGTPSAQALQQRNAAIVRIEQDCGARTHDRCSVVRLFSGGRYDLYQYKTYSDLRLVFAPENDLAFFGRTRDSITYLRYGLDIAFLRAYENGKPAGTPHYLKWSREGVQEKDLVFSLGNPATTMRLSTSAQLAFYRDTQLPLVVGRLQARIKTLGDFAAKDPRNVAAIEPVLNEILAKYKASAGLLIGLRDERLVARKTNFEGKIRRAVLADSKLGADANKVWDEVAAAYKNWTPFEKPYQILEADPAPGSNLFRATRQIVRRTAPDSSYPTPANEALETALIAEYLEELKGLGEKDASVKAILNGKNSVDAAEGAVKSKDAMVHLAMTIDEPARRLRKRHDEIIGALEASAAEKIAQYRFKLFGASDYPDSTGSPRIEFGVVKPYVDRAGVMMPAKSSFGGLYYRNGNQGPYQVPQRWVDLKSSLNLSQTLDFVSTCDIGGGDPGSPTVNRSGELVGIVFDGNLESLPDVYLYSDEQARAVHVSAAGIQEALEKVYKAAALLQELGLRARD
jgi:hypothetical protein